MASDIEIAAMRRALVLAADQGVATGPNPRVGCVLLDAAGATVGEGAHRGVGTPHAEVAALETVAAGAARGATAVVTLEPCNHTGRTGPCAAALVAAGVARVVFAQSDVNPVASGGAAGLRTAGVDVEEGVLAAEAEALNPYWTFAVREGRPFVTWKLAASLDGRVAAADGSSRWISGTAARADVHRLRAEADVVVVGIGTVLADDPELTVRPGGSEQPALPRDRQPLRVVIGRRSGPTGARVLDDAAPTLVVTTDDVGTALAELATREVRHVLLEGGPTLAGAFVRAGLVDRVVSYVAPVLLGAGPARSATRASTPSRARCDWRSRTSPGSGPTYASPHGSSGRGAKARSAPRERADMFTGIVEELGEVVSVEPQAGAARLTISGPTVVAGARHGDSIAVNGVCLTVVETDGSGFTADVMAETLSRSSLGALVAGSRVNLERPVTLADRLGGHLVQGHVDGTGGVVSRTPAEHWELVRVSLPPGLARYVVEKGSITVDGVSLTVVEVGPDWFTVSLIPTTLELTTLGRKQPGEPVNLEVDVIAKYVEKLMEARS